MNKRPVISEHVANIDILIDRAAIVCFLFMWASFIFSYLQMPEIIVTHFGIDGKADDFGHKATLFLLPIAGSVFYIVLSAIIKKPQTFNHSVKITAANGDSRYRSAVRILKLLKLFILFVFSVVILFSYLISIGITKDMSSWFLPFVFICPLLLASLSTAQSLKKEKK